MLEVGVNTYVTVETASVYIVNNYQGTRAQTWAALSNTAQESALLNACLRLDSLSYRGVTLEACQPLAFPRYFGDHYAMVYRTLEAPELDIYPELKTVPEAIKYAQIEEALEIAVPSDDTATSATINGAVKSYSIGHLSETFKTATEGSAAAVLASAKAQRFVAQFLGGAYEIH